MVLCQVDVNFCKITFFENRYKEAFENWREDDCAYLLWEDLVACAHFIGHLQDQYIKFDSIWYFL